MVNFLISALSGRRRRVDVRLASIAQPWYKSKDDKLELGGSGGVFFGLSVSSVVMIDQRSQSAAANADRASSSKSSPSDESDSDSSSDGASRFRPVR